SDLHLEHYPAKYNKFNNIIKPTVIKDAENSSQILLLCGDIGHPNTSKYINFLEYCSKNYEKTFIITGNHEYYYSDFNQINSFINQLCKSFSNIYFLNNKSHSINSKWVILGTTLWSEIKDKDIIKDKMNDYHKITINNKILTPEFTIDLYNKNVDWIKKQIKKHNDKNIIIMTHHLPSFKTVVPQWKNNIVNQAFASNLDN